MDLGEETYVTNSSITTASDMSTSSDDSCASERNVSDKGVQTECPPMVSSQPNTNSIKYAPTCVNINLSYQDRVSLWVQGSNGSDELCDNNNSVQSSTKINSAAQQQPESCKNPVVIVSKEKVTLRINPGRQSVQRRLSDATLYEDIEEASEWMSKEYLSSLRKYNSSSKAPPPLPPRLFSSSKFSQSCDKIIRRKNLNHLLGIDEQMDLSFLRNNNVNSNAIKNLLETGRIKSRKDLTKFLGINDVKLRKRCAVGKRHADHRRSKSIIDNILSATKHFKSSSNQDDQKQHFVESDSQLGHQRDQGRYGKIISEMMKDGQSKKDVTRIEEFDHLHTAEKIVCGKENDGDTDKDSRFNKRRTGSFSSVSSTSSSRDSLAEKSSFTKIFRNSSRRFSTSGVELMESIRRKSALRRKYQSSLDDIPLESGNTDELSLKDKSYVEEFIKRGMPVIPFDQPLMVFIDSKQEPVKTIPAKKRKEDYVSVSDSLDTLIRLARGQLSSESFTSSLSESNNPSSASDEPIYIEMSKCSSSLASSRPTISEYMDMDLVQSLSNMSCS